MDTENTKIGFIGCGSMGSAIIHAVCKKFNPQNIKISAKHFEHAKKVADAENCIAAASNAEAANGSKYIFLAVKPVHIKEIIDEIKKNISDDAVLISMAPGITLKELSEKYDAPYVRIMPNVGAKISQSMTAIAYSEEVSQEDLNGVKEILAAAGKVETVDEKLMRCVTAVSGSGPAYAFVFIEALADAAVRFGMPRKEAYIYASQTLKGAAEMVLSSGDSPAVLKDSVCSPGGTTIEGIAALEHFGFRNSIIEAVSAAFKKSSEISIMR